MRPGDSVFFGPGEDHWHGAAPATRERRDQSSVQKSLLAVLVWTPPAVHLSRLAAIF